MTCFLWGQFFAQFTSGWVQSPYSCYLHHEHLNRDTLGGKSRLPIKLKHQRQFLFFKLL